MEPRSRPGILPSALLSASVGLLPAAVHADQLDTFQPFVDAQVMHDDNVFRVSPSVDPSLLGLTKGKSDTSLATQVGVKMDKTWSLQHVVLDASLTHVGYQNYGFLNYDATAYDASWLWKFTPRVSGTLALDQTQSLANFADFRHFNSREVITVSNRTYNVDWDVEGGWHALGGLVQSEYKNSVPFSAQTDSRLNSVQVGGKYYTTAGNWASFVVRDGHGKNPAQPLYVPQQLDNEYDQRDVEAALSWNFTAKSTLTARLAQRNHGSTHFSSRSFSGTVGQVDVTWGITGKISANASVGRDMSPFVDAQFPYYTSSYLVSDTVMVGGTWSTTANTDVRLKYQHIDRSFKGELFPNFIGRKDTPEITSLTADWMPLRSVLVSATLQHEHRGATIPGYDYSDSMLSVSGQWSF